MSPANEPHATPTEAVDAQALQALQDGFAAVHDIALKLAGRGDVQEILDTAIVSASDPGGGAESAGADGLEPSPPQAPKERRKAKSRAFRLMVTNHAPC